MKKYSLLVAISLIALVSGCTKAQNNGVLISPADAGTLIEKDTALVILDVRTPGEFNSGTGHLKNAILIPVGELENRLQELEFAKDKTILVYCRSGHRSGIASEILLKNGYKIRDLQGGISHWKAEDLPVVQETPQQ